MNQEAPDTRRSSPRVKCRWQVKCVTEQKKTFTTNAVNVSQGGIQIVTPVVFKHDDRLYMEIQSYVSGQSHIIKVVGLAVYFSVSTNNETHLGLKFISSLTMEDSKTLQRYAKVMLGN